MRVLYVVYRPIPLSENYIRTELEWMEKQGIAVGVWASAEKIAPTYEDPGRWMRVGGSILKAIDEWKPDIVHAHWSTVAAAVLGEVKKTGIPCTIRGHSLDFSTANVEAVSSASQIWLFPHFARQFALPQVAPLPVSYDSHTFYLGSPAPRRYVIRATAGLPRKGIEEFLDIARLCPEASFVLVMTSILEPYMDSVVKSAPLNVTCLKHVQREEVARLVRGAWICLRGHDPAGNPYGMPISIAEAMGCGIPLIARKHPDAEAYMADAATYYGTPEEGAALLRQTLAWTIEERAEASLRAAARARLFTTEVILPAVMRTWQNLVRK